MKEITYYTTIESPYKRKVDFKNELEVELVTFVGTVKQLDEKRLEIEVKASDLFNENQAKRRREENLKLEEFKNDLAKENGLEDNPKLEKLWAKAWEHGHSSGLNEVKCYFEDFAELIK